MPNAFGAFHFLHWRFPTPVPNRNRNRNPVNRRLDHEKLEVYQASLAFVAWLEPILRQLPKGLAVTDQLDRASTSIALNIAEGNGKYTGPDRGRYFDHARGSALECSAALDVLVAKERYRGEELSPGKDRLWSIVSMLVGLIKANSDYRMHDREQDYDYDYDYE